MNLRTEALPGVNIQWQPRQLEDREDPVVKYRSVLLPTIGAGVGCVAGGAAGIIVGPPGVLFGCGTGGLVGAEAGIMVDNAIDLIDNIKSTIELLSR